MLVLMVKRGTVGCDVECDSLDYNRMVCRICNVSSMRYVAS